MLASESTEQLGTNGVYCVGASDVTIDTNTTADATAVDPKPTRTQRLNRKLKAAGARIKQEAADVFTKRFLYRRVPVTEWLPRYKLDDLICDAIAGFTVGLTVLPQGIAYGVVAGMPPQYGLYSAFMGCFVYFFLGSTKDITIGPTAIMSLLSAPYVASLGLDFCILLTFITGVINLLMGILHLGFLVDFISMPVTAGFTSAAAITIASTQVKSLLGMPGTATDFIDAWRNTYNNIGKTNVWDMTLGLVTIVLLLLAKQMANIDKGRDMNTMGLPRKLFGKFIKLVALGRNAVVVIAGTVLAYLLYTNNIKPFTLSGKVVEGLPPFQPPPFSSTQHNVTRNFVQLIGELGSATITIPLIAMLESIAVAKSFANGKILDATQEMIALGIANILGSFVSSIPTTGSFSRTAVNNASGVRTQVGGLFTGSLVLLALGLLTSTFFFIPKANLAGIIICAMFFMVEYEAVIILWRTKKLDLIPLLTTFVSCLLIGLDLGIIIGIAVNLIFILYITARPKIQTKELMVDDVIHVLLVTPETSLIYPAAEYVRELVVKSSFIDSIPVTVVIIDGSLINVIDATMAENLKSLVKDLELRKQTVIFWNWKRKSIQVCKGFDKDLVRYFRFEGTVESLVRPEAGAEPEVRVATTGVNM